MSAGVDIRRPAHVYPFSAIVGQDVLKSALLLNAIEPRIGGVLIRGQKGTAKSTAVRALAAVLPEVAVVDGCRYGCDPGDPGGWCDDCRERRSHDSLPRSRRKPRIVELPVSATQDRLVGTLDFERALRDGERAFQPGLFADANRGILYVDEVNLLDDYLVDTLLDAAAMGVNIVEREGVSFMHPARFILVGTMNPEEGEIRPQLLDRFGLCVEVSAMSDPEARVEIMRRRREFEDEPGVFSRKWEQAEDELRDTLRGAQLRLRSITVPDEILYAVADLCIRAQVDGHRADHVIVRAASALAALDGHDTVSLLDVERVAPMALAHRLSRSPFEPVKADAESLRSALVRSLSGDETADSSEGASPGRGQGSIFEALTADSGDTEASVGAKPAMETATDQMRRSVAGKRHESVSSDGRGRYRRSETPAADAPVSDIAFDATIRAAATRPGQERCTSSEHLAISITRDDIRTKVRTRKVGASLVFCVDASGSMGASARMTAAKTAILDLLKDAYQRRDRVALVSFRGNDADVVVPPTSSVELANLKMRSLPTGGSTPLAAGLAKSLELIDAELRRDPGAIPWLILVTDGRANVGLSGGLGSDDARVMAAKFKERGIRAVVIDTTGGSGAGASAREIARNAGAEYVRLNSLDGPSVAAAVRERVASA